MHPLGVECLNLSSKSVISTHSQSEVATHIKTLAKHTTQIYNLVGLIKLQRIVGPMV